MEISSGASWVVSVGDSYVSGEAGRWAGNTDGDYSRIDALGPTAYDDNGAGTGEQIPNCHRSHSAEIYIGGLVNGYNLACSGAETTTNFSNGYFKPGLDFYSDQSGNQGQALVLQNFASTHKVKMIAVSIGGNNFNFGSIIKTCVEDYLLPASTATFCKSDSSVDANFTAANIANQISAIATALRNVHKAMANDGYADSDYTILVQNYPSPIPTSSGFRYTQSGWTRQNTGGCGFSDPDADWAVGTALPTINNAVFSAAQQAGLSNIAFMDLSAAAQGHQLCQNTVGLLEEQNLASWQSPGAMASTEWINQIRSATTLGGPYAQQESLHPNYWGQLALRNCLRQAYNGGAVQSGKCASSAGTDSRGEPSMSLSPLSDITNGGFETGGGGLFAGSLFGWTASGTASALIGAGHSGSFAAQLGSTNPTNGDSSISQAFTAPPGDNTLSFWYDVTCPDSLTYDWASASLRDLTTNTTATALPKTCTANEGWIPVSTPVIPGHAYRLTLTSHDDNNPGDPTRTLFDDVTLSDAVPLQPPTNVSVGPGGNLLWQGSAGAVGYVVSRDFDYGYTIVTKPQAGNTYEFVDAADGKAHTYKVRAFGDANTLSAPSLPVTEPPVNLSRGSQGQVCWDQVVDHNATNDGYFVHADGAIGPTASVYPSSSQGKVCWAPPATYGWTSGSHHAINVATFGEGGLTESRWSQPGSLDYTYMAPPANPALSNECDRGFQLSWDPVSGAVSYNVYGNGQTLSTGITSTYTDFTSPAGQAYSVTAVAADGSESILSNAVSSAVWDPSAC